MKEIDETEIVSYTILPGDELSIRVSKVFGTSLLCARFLSKIICHRLVQNIRF